ncbi:MAG: 7-cyano-7-deazaguanine synthase QueC [Candidatus Omnitrophota bacterium]
MKKAIILLSGGIDSTTTLYLARENGFFPIALIFDYGQRHRREIEAAKRIAGQAGCKYKILKLDLPWKGSSLTDKRRAIPVKRSLRRIKSSIPSTYVPARNMIFLSMAASFAESVNAFAIFIGAHSEDYSGYPDCRKEFFKAFGSAMGKGTKAGRKLKIHAPLLGKRKRDIIKTAVRLNVPLGMTWSCYKGGKRPCGVCDSCFFRSRAFKELGIEDPGLRKK